MVLVWYVGWHCNALYGHLDGQTWENKHFFYHKLFPPMLQVEGLVSILFQWHWTYTVATMSYLHTLQKHVPLSETWQAFIPANDTKTSRLRVCQKMINEVDKMTADW